MVFSNISFFEKMYYRLEFGGGTDYLLHRKETYCKNYLSSIVILLLDPYSGKNVPLFGICVIQIRVRDAVWCRMVSAQVAD